MTTRLRPTALLLAFPLAALAASAALAACGGSVPPPTMQGREGMLSKTAVAQKCEEAAREHDRPFVVEWDATDLSSFEAKASRDTVFVHYEGCKMDVLYECSNPAIASYFGNYGLPTYTSGTVQGFDVENEGDLYARLPLGAASLSGKVAAGEMLHLKYFVSGVATDTRDAIYRGDLAKLPGCARATHFVWAYNLGAFELSSSERDSQEAEVGIGNAGAGGHHAHREAQLGNGGNLGSCTTQDQRGCKVPIRLALRAISDGENPAGAMPVGSVAGMVPGGPGAPGAGAPTSPGNAAAVAHEALMNASISQQASEILQEAAKKMMAGDGTACLALMNRALSMDPRMGSGQGYNRARCEMLAGKCKEGTADMRATIAARPENKMMTDEMLDKQARDAANRDCPASTATSDLDWVTRASRDLATMARADVKDGRACKEKFEALDARMAKLSSTNSEERRAYSEGTRALLEAAQCVAASMGCDKGLPLHKRAYAHQLPGMTGVDKIATENWNTQIKLGHLKCR